MKEKQKMQNVSFKHIADLIDYLPEDERKLLIKLRSIIQEHAPQARERLSFQVPFYKINKDICFLWPGSVLWGKTKMYDGVRLGFTNGHLLQDQTGYLDMGDRKQVAYHDFKSLKDIDEERISTYLYLAIDIDESHARK